MKQNLIILYDTGRVPLLLRLPALFLSILLLWMSTSIISENLGGSDLLLHNATGHKPGIWAIIPTLALAWFFLYLWFARKRIFYDASQHQLIIQYNILIRRQNRKLSLENLKGIYVTPKSIRASKFCDIGLLFEKKRIYLTREYGDAKLIAGELATVLKVRVVME